MQPDTAHATGDISACRRVVASSMRAGFTQFTPCAVSARRAGRFGTSTLCCGHRLARRSRHSCISRDSSFGTSIRRRCRRRCGQVPAQMTYPAHDLVCSRLDGPCILHATCIYATKLLCTGGSHYRRHYAIGLLGRCPLYSGRACLLCSSASDNNRHVRAYHASFGYPHRVCGCGFTSDVCGVGIPRFL